MFSPDESEASSGSVESSHVGSAWSETSTAMHQVNAGAGKPGFPDLSEAPETGLGPEVGDFRWDPRCPW